MLQAGTHPQSLAQLASGQKGVVSAINGDAHFIGRITAIGLTVGCPVEILRNERRQPVLLYSRDTMIAMDKREGEKIMVKIT
ncbi:MAG: ferrous iron transport protein A [Treponema sp.]|nr:ferrous iron transport protein A [Treponema sp.]